MTLVKRTLNVIEHFEKLLQNKFFKTLAITVFVSFFIFTTFGAYAQEETLEDYAGYKITMDGAYEEGQSLTNIINGVPETEQNNATMSMTSIESTLVNVTAILCPDCFENGEELAQSENVSYLTKRGFLGVAEDGIVAMVSNPPALDVPSHLAEEWIPGYEPTNTSIYAVGRHDSGYQELKNAGVDILWGKVRNIAYLVFVVIMIVIGFMIMFRSKIGGQTMVTVGNAIPNVIIALVLVTFSFAIAGLIIDLGGLILIFIASILGGGELDYSEFTTISNPFGITWIAFSGKGNLIGTTLGLAGIVGGAVGVVAGVSKVATGSIWEKMGGVAHGAIVGGVAALVVVLAVVGIVGYGAIKLWFMLLKSYLTVLIQVVAAPLIIMSAALPGNMKAFTNWMKGIAKNVLVFPATFALINLPNALFATSDDVILRLPGALIFKDPSEYGGTIGNLGSQLFVAILEVILIYAASQIPAFLETVLPSDSSPAMQKAGQKTQEALTKMPIFGSVFK